MGYMLLLHFVCAVSYSRKALLVTELVMFPQTKTIQLSVSELLLSLDICNAFPGRCNVFLLISFSLLDLKYNWSQRLWICAAIVQGIGSPTVNNIKAL